MDKNTKTLSLIEDTVQKTMKEAERDLNAFELTKKFMDSYYEKRSSIEQEKWKQDRMLFDAAIAGFKDIHCSLEVAMALFATINKEG